MVHRILVMKPMAHVYHSERVQQMDVPNGRPPEAVHSYCQADEIASVASNGRRCCQNPKKNWPPKRRLRRRSRLP